MYIQGDLQKVFDALFNLGVIDPILEADWIEAQKLLPRHYKQLEKAVSTANSFQGDVSELMVKLKEYDETVLGYLAMEVAREFSNFHERKKIH